MASRTLTDGSPIWGKHLEEKYGQRIKSCDEAFYEYWVGGPVDFLYANWP